MFFLDTERGSETLTRNSDPRQPQRCNVVTANACVGQTSRVVKISRSFQTHCRMCCVFGAFHCWQGCLSRSETCPFFTEASSPHASIDYQRGFEPLFTWLPWCIRVHVNQEVPLLFCTAYFFCGRTRVGLDRTRFVYWRCARVKIYLELLHLANLDTL